MIKEKEQDEEFSHTRWKKAEKLYYEKLEKKKAAKNIDRAVDKLTEKQDIKPKIEEHEDESKGKASRARRKDRKSEVSTNGDTLESGASDDKSENTENWA